MEANGMKRCRKKKQPRIKGGALLLAVCCSHMMPWSAMATLATGKGHLVVGACSLMHVAFTNSLIIFRISTLKVIRMILFGSDGP